MDDLFSAVYSELHGLAGWFVRRERPGHTLQPTALVHEAYLRLLGRFSQTWEDRSHFFAVTANVMRHLLVDYARSRGSAKRSVPSAEQLKPPAHISDDQLALILSVDTALIRLEKLDPRMARIVEMRYFAGLTEEEIGLLLNLSSRQVKRDWRVARVWLQAQFRDESGQRAASV